MRGGYLLALLLSISGLGLIDWRYRLAYFYNKRATLTSVISMIVIFVIWDIIGIRLGVFFIGETDWLVGIQLGEFPIEELFFLLLLNYSALIIYRYLQVQRQKI